MKYRTIVADPPWRYERTGTVNWRGQRTDAEGHYPTMSDGEIAMLPIEDLIDDNAHLYLWITNPRLFEARPHRIAAAWGFEYKTLLTWVKTGAPGLGSYFRGNTEHVLFCIRGSAAIPPAIRERNHFIGPRRSHSEKPDSFFDLVQRVSPGPYLELFARTQRLGWDTWGNEALEHVELTA